MSELPQNINESERGSLLDLGKALRKLLEAIGQGGVVTPPPSGGSGWLFYDTSDVLETQNPLLPLGASAFEKDTLRWKFGQTGINWNDLPYQDEYKTPDPIDDPGAAITFPFRPMTTQVVTYDTIPVDTTLNATLEIPTDAPPIEYEGFMFVVVFNTSPGSLALTVPEWNIFGEVFEGTLAPDEAIEFTIWVHSGNWYVEGGAADVAGGAGVPADGSITNAKLSDVATGTIKGRLTAATGPVEDLTILQVKNQVLANDGITNSLLANMATSTLKGRLTAATGDPEDLTFLQVQANLDSSPPIIETISGDATLTAATHQGKTLICNGTLILTVNNSTDFAQHTQCIIWARGGAVTISDMATVNTATGLVMPQHSVGILQRDTNADTYVFNWMGRPSDVAVISSEANNIFNGSIWAGTEANKGTTAGTLYFTV